MDWCVIVDYIPTLDSIPVLYLITLLSGGLPLLLPYHLPPSSSLLSSLMQRYEREKVLPSPDKRKGRYSPPLSTLPRLPCHLRQILLDFDRIGIIHGVCQSEWDQMHLFVGGIDSWAFWAVQKAERENPGHPVAREFRTVEHCKLALFQWPRLSI